MRIEALVNNTKTESLKDMLLKVNLKNTVPFCIFVKSSTSKNVISKFSTKNCYSTNEKRSSKVSILAIITFLVFWG